MLKDLEALHAETGPQPDEESDAGDPDEAAETHAQAYLERSTRRSSSVLPGSRMAST